MSTTATYKPAANGDNVTWNQLAYFYNDIANSWIGKPASASWWKSSLRFPSVGVPKLATINAAKITFNAHANFAGTVNATIYGNDIDDAVAPTNLTEAGNLVNTTASVAWTDIAEWTVGNNYDSVDISTIVQEIVNRSGWASGQAMQFMIFDNASADNAGRGYHNYKEGLDYCPILTITYTYIIAEPIEVTSAIELTSAEPTDWNVLIAPVTNIISSIGLQGVYEVHLSSYCYEETTKGIASDLFLKTRDGIGTDILNIFRRKNAKYLWYDADTNGQDLVVSFYVDGVLQDKTLTINTTGRVRDRLDLWNMEGYRFAIKLNAQDVRERGMKIYSPWNIIYDYAGV